MAKTEFDIYQTAQGYVAVTNPVRRQILDALAHGDQELPALVRLTRKAKPTLSSVHMKQLLAQGLVTAVPHGADGRRKSFRLIAARIGSSNVPVDRLRDAVKEYVSASPLAARFPISLAFQAILAAPPEVASGVLRAQAARLGEGAAPLLSPTTARDFLLGAARFLEQERVARPLRLDLEHQAAELAFGEALGRALDPGRLVAVIVGFLEGLGRTAGLFSGAIVIETFDHDDRFRLLLPVPSSR